MNKKKHVLLYFIFEQNLYFYLYFLKIEIDRGGSPEFFFDPVPNLGDFSFPLQGLSKLVLKFSSIRRSTLGHSL